MNYSCTELEEKSVGLIESKTKFSLKLSKDLLQTIIITISKCIYRLPRSWAHAVTHSVSTVSYYSVFTCLLIQLNQEFNICLNRSGMDNPMCELRTLFVRAHNNVRDEYDLQLLNVLRCRECMKC